MEQVEKDRFSALDALQDNDKIKFADLLVILMIGVSVQDIVTGNSLFTWAGMIAYSVVCLAGLLAMLRWDRIRPTRYAKRRYVIFLALVIPVIAPATTRHVLDFATPAETTLPAIEGLK